MPEPQQVIYSMVRVGRVYPPNKQVLRDISLGFFYGAKIGVLGLNGAGKSTLLRIMAGVDKDYLGETMLSKGYSRGLLEQEPPLDATKTVRQIVEEGVQPIVDLLRQYDEMNAKFSDPDADYRQADGRAGPAAGRSRQARRLEPRQPAGTGDGRACAARPARRPSRSSPAASGGAWRCAGCCSTEPDILLLDEPTNHLDAESVAWLERHLQAYQGTVIAVTHDRYFLDNVAEWILELDRGYGIPWRGQLLVVAGAEAGSLAAARRRPTRGASSTLEARAGVDSHVAQGAAGQGPGARHRLRAAIEPGNRGAPRGDADLHPARPAAG